MSKLRSVNTHFWNDNYIVDLDPIEKLLFLYLLTNPNTNMLGVYELHIRKISFDTGIDKDMVLKIFDRFEKAGKASYIEGYVCLHNFTKHQAYNGNMKISAINSYNDLPQVIKNSKFMDNILKALKPLPKGSKPIAEIEREVEEEGEEETESSNIPLLQDVKDYFTENGYSQDIAEKAFNYYQESVNGTQKKYWRDSKGNMIKNWKMKMRAVWFKDENKSKNINETIDRLFDE